ncbi:hypothetical protein K474DRAFT_1700840 [Panus rudis PR-1116 ss-1]|nr:hypothetical protein K474DRAFT_1700840 [Panus rudis PR-1116 ss-1]
MTEQANTSDLTSVLSPGLSIRQLIQRLPSPQQLSQYNPASEAIQAWASDEEVATLQYLSAVRSLRNATVPFIHRLLPDELILHILMLAAHGRTRFALQLICVCRKWYNIAMSNGQYWSYIDLLDERTSEVFIARSQRADLYIVFNSVIHHRNYHKPPFKKEIFLPLVDRIAGMEFVLRGGTDVNLLDMEQFQPVFQSSLPRLQSFSISNWFSSRHSKSLSLPDIRLEHTLKRLDLEFVTFDWTSPITNNLRVLQLRQHLSNDQHPSFDTFLDLLERCPNLEELVLHHAGPHLDTGKETYQPPRRIFHLEKLRHLAIEDKAFDIAHLLSHLVIPPWATVSLFGMTGDYRPGAFFQVLPSSLDGFGPIRGAKFIRLKFSHSLLQAHLEGCFLPETSRPYSVSITNHVWNIPIPATPIATAVPTLGMARIFQDSTVEMFLYEAESFPGTSFFEHMWREILPAMQNLRTLSLQFVDPTDLGVTVDIDNLDLALQPKYGDPRYVLGQITSAFQSASLGQPVCPRLTTLCMIDFEIGDFALSLLEEMCTCRRSTGVAMKRLVFRDCSYDGMHGSLRRASSAILGPFGVEIIFSGTRGEEELPW